MEDYRSAQREFFGRVLDDSPTLDGTLIQNCIGWMMIEFLLPYLRFFDDLRYVWGLHPDQHKNAISIPASKIKQLKQELTPAPSTLTEHRARALVDLIEEVIALVADNDDQL